MALPFPLSGIGQAAATLYTAGAGLRAWAFRNGWRRRQHLQAKVISIGNLSWGGTGKTPFTIWLAEQLVEAGVRPSILTRGHGRLSTEPVLLIPPGTSPESARHHGDEVQLYLRHGLNVPIGIAASRYAAGRGVEESFAVDVHLLDDGFQHLSLTRDLDIVLVDAQNPWGTRWGISRVLRESPRALRRAGAFLLTNCADAGENRTSSLNLLKEDLRRWNPQAPQFHASVSVSGFVESEGEKYVVVEAMQGRRALAFCGLGSPQNFFASLKRAGVECLAERRFRDHHRYRMEDLRALEQQARQLGAECLITTEKDVVNLPPEVTLGLPLYWAIPRFAVQESTELLHWVISTLGFRTEFLGAKGNSATISDRTVAVNSSQ